MSPQSLIHPVSACFYNSVSRFAVPCFIMLSGAFILERPENGEYQSFYKKSFSKIGIHTLAFTGLYTAYRIVCCLLQKELDELLTIVKDVVKGSPMYHMWYLYMLIGLYLLAPVCVRFKNSISECIFERVAIGFLFAATLSRWTTENVRMSWNIGQSFEYLGYFMTGYVLRRNLAGKANNVKGLLMIAAGLALEAGTSLIEYHFQIVQGIPESKLNYQIVSPYAPTIVLASILIFAGFSCLNIRANQIITQLSKLSFYIYLCHAGIWDILKKIVRLTEGKDFLMLHTDNVVMIPIFVLAVLIFSITAARIYSTLYGHFREVRKTL